MKKYQKLKCPKLPPHIEKVPVTSSKGLSGPDPD